MVLVALAITACGRARSDGTHHGRSLNDIALQSGVFYTARIGTDTGDVPWEHGLNVEATLSASVDTPEQVRAAVGYLLELAWSETDVDPKDGTSIELRTVDGTDVDIRPTVLRLVDDDTILADGTSWYDILTRLYGRWPGPLPDVPETLKSLADIRCDTDLRPGPFGTHGCEQLAKTATDTGVFEYAYLRTAASSEPGKDDVVLTTTLVRTASKRNFLIRVTDDAASDIVDAAAQDYLLRLAWAETSIMPTGRILVFGMIDSFENDTTGCGTLTAETSGFYSAASFDYECMVSRYGPWPGPVPELPPELADLLSSASPVVSPTASPSPS